MDVQSKLERIVAMVEGARAMPMSASCIVNRGELLGLLDELTQMLPSELHDAANLLREREDVVASGRREAEQIVAAAHVERDELVSETEVFREASVQADRIRAEAEQSAERMRTEVDDYVDGKLANFEIVLNKTLTAVLRGRDKLSGRTETDALAEYAAGREEASDEGDPLGHGGEQIMGQL